MRAIRLAGTIALVLVLGVIGFRVPPAPAGAQSSGDSIWHLPASAYPKRAIIHPESPTNAAVQQLFGEFHVHTFDQLGRIDGRGWVQPAGIQLITKVVRGHRTKRIKHTLYWGYAVSYFASDAGAEAALADLSIRTTLALERNRPVAIRSITATAGGQFATYTVFSGGPVEVEVLCAVVKRDKKAYGRRLNHECRRLRSRLIAILSQVESYTPALTLTPTPTPTATPIPTLTPTNTPTVTPIPLSTASPIPTPTDTPLPTSTPTPRFSYSVVKDYEDVTDNLTGVLVLAGIAEVGEMYSVDSFGTNPGPGDIFLWVLAGEATTTSEPYVSSYFNFKVQNSEGVVYSPGPGYPIDRAGPTMPVATLTNGENNVGWMEFEVPNQSDTYTLLWNEDEVIPDLPIAKLKISIGAPDQVQVESP